MEEHDPLERYIKHGKDRQPLILEDEIYNQALYYAHTPAMHKLVSYARGTMKTNV